MGHVRLDEIRVAGPESSVSLPGPPSLPWDRGSAWAASSGHLPPSAPPSAASYDKRIVLWDIGVPNHDYEFQAR